MLNEEADEGMFLDAPLTLQVYGLKLDQRSDPFLCVLFHLWTTKKNPFQLHLTHS